MSHAIRPIKQGTNLNPIANATGGWIDLNPRWLMGCVNTNAWPLGNRAARRLQWRIAMRRLPQKDRNG